MVSMMTKAMHSSILLTSSRPSKPGNLLTLQGSIVGYQKPAHDKETSHTMFRQALRTIAVARPALATTTSIRPAAAAATNQLRFYAGANVNKSDIEARVLDIVRAFDKVKDPSKVRCNTLPSFSVFRRSLCVAELTCACRSPHRARSPTTSDSTRSTPSRSSWPSRRNSTSRSPTRRPTRSSLSVRPSTTLLNILRVSLSRRS